MPLLLPSPSPWVDIQTSSKMASRAHERAQKILGNPTQEQLAQLIMDDVSAQSANAEDLGVLAYVRKPVHREKPNERFLLGTIRSVAFANRKTEEDEMWNQRKRRLQASRYERGHTGMGSDDTPAHCHERNGKHHDSGTSGESQDDNGGREAHDAAAEGPMSDEQLAEILSKRRIRGRGGIGSRAEEAGPFLSASAAADDDLREDEGSRQHARPAGPERPSWLPRSSETSPDRCSPAGRPSERLKAKAEKKHRKSKKNKQHKEKRRRVKELDAAKDAQ